MASVFQDVDATAATRAWTDELELGPLATGAYEVVALLNGLPLAS